MVGAWMAVIACGLTAAAGVISESRTDLRVGPGARGYFAFQRFDPALGRLQGVSVAIDPSSRIDATANASVDGEAAELVSATLTASLRLTGAPLSDPLSGSTSFLVGPRSTAASWFTAFGGGARVSYTDEATLLRWTGLGAEEITWEVTDPTFSIQSDTALVGVQIENTFIRVTVKFYYTPPSLPSSLEYDASVPAFLYREVERPVVIEWKPDFQPSTPWSPRYESGTNAPGTVVRLLLDGITGFYRVRFRDPDPALWESD